MLGLHNLLREVSYLESIIFLAASAYLKSSLRASSLYLMRDNLEDTDGQTDGGREWGQGLGKGKVEENSLNGGPIISWKMCQKRGRSSSG